MKEKKIEKADKVKKEITREYDKNPKEWHVLMGSDSENYLSSLFLHHDKFWMIKEFTVNPYKSIGLGTMRRIRDKKLGELKTPIGFGLRPFKKSQIKALLEGNSSILMEILESSPLSSKKCSSAPLILEGPISMSNRPVISKSQEELDRKLRKDLRELISRKYPEMMRSYR